MNNTAAGQAVNFLSPMELVPGYNPDAAEAWKQWSETIISKGVSLWGTGAINTQPELTSLSGEVSVAAPIETKIVAPAEAVALPALATATTADIAMHGSCFGGSIMNSVFTPPANTVNMNGTTVHMPDETDPATYGVQP